VSTNQTPEFLLWSDDPTTTDLLSFNAVAGTVTDALLDDNLDPVAIGISGRWGSGKTTVLRLINDSLVSQNLEDSKVLIVNTDPWRYDPTTGAKESLISEVLTALQKEIKPSEGTGDKAKKLMSRLVKRVDWAKAIRLTTKAAVALQIPSFDDLLDIVKDKPDDDEEVRGLEAFRGEFAQLMQSDELSHVRRVVVLVDDLDRCLPETVVETLEAIRLFLAVPKMSFVLAADEDRVAEAIRTRFPESKPVSSDGDSQPAEEPASLYLHKIVQTTVPIPALSRFDTQAYVLLLLLMTKLDEEKYRLLIQQCDDLRRNSKDLGDMQDTDGIDISDDMAFAARLTPLLYEKLQGNPRRIKRFLNDLHVRQSIAARRGIALEAEVVAKLMVLEVLLSKEFRDVLDWLARGELRANMEALEFQARHAKGESTASNTAKKEETQNEGEEPTFSDQLIRWAKLTPSLGAVDLAPYLHLAASFSGKTLLDQDLPERLRDIAINLLSDIKAEQHSVRDEDLLALTTSDAVILVAHLGRMGRDRPNEQRKAVAGILRVFRVHGSIAEETKEALLTIPADEVALPSILLFVMPQDNILRPVLDSWTAATTKSTTKTAIGNLLNSSGNQ
jgi:predicted KAP-like P-loop ATPase